MKSLVSRQPGNQIKVCTKASVEPRLNVRFGALLRQKLVKRGSTAQFNVNTLEAC